MKMTILDFNRADDRKTNRGSMEINGVLKYGFFVNKDFYYTENKEYFVVLAK